MNINKIEETLKKDENGLLPCPFCGSKGQLFCIDGHSKWVLCIKCGLKSAELDTVEEVIELWNTRPQLISELVEEYKKVLDALTAIKRIESKKLKSSIGFDSEIYQIAALYVKENSNE